ncbi:hypothetical protein ACWGHM_10140 [Streptomyces sp. NPDC054904]|uniref:hypothetical protein n=1 Tax=unclassified Streptomyces TaxID=2593676 RepID=UPI0024819C51|nr:MULTISPECIES: hypothetical protein [unclassified Streptomyces]MDA5283989.1 hypothetical protein [Streptomyces sp. Isolate_45]MDX2390606.1 hypothetical protein [Streptomyces sp. DK15]
MRTPRTSTAALLAALALAGAAAPVAAAPSPTPTPSGAGDSAGPTEAGTGFRTATAFRPGERATAAASTGDYLYWVLPVDAGQRVTVRATVTLPEPALRHGPATWQLDVYDGLRRRQACAYGTQTKAAAKEAVTAELSCTLRTVRSGAEPWANDPLPGSYYVRLTVVGLPEDDLGLPVRAQVEADVKDVGGAVAVDAALAEPLVPGIAGAPEEQRAARAPEDGWSGGRWSDRWVWTAAGGVLAALAGVFGYSLARGSGRPAGTRSTA